MPLMKGNSRLMAAPLINDHTVGGLYRMTGEFDDGGDDSSSPPEYSSLSECIVIPDSVRSLRGSLDDIGGERAMSPREEEEDGEKAGDSIAFG